MNSIKALIASITLAGVVGCGSSSDTEDTSNQVQKRVIGLSENALCVLNTEQSVQWEKLKTENATNLSEYQLFQNQCDPTDNPNNRGLAYDLSTPLFTDYASKYRFIFVPNDTTATYNASEVFDFPIGSVLVKTFSVPLDTSDRGIEKEELIETRLMIHRESGWEALPYIWNADKSDAILTLIGGNTDVELKHGEEDLEFTYGVPNSQQCIRCHQFKPEGGSIGKSPIGPKARYLNSDKDYGTGPINQISKWVEYGILSGVPSNTAEIESVPVFNDDVDVNSISPSQLDSFARGWLDINCAHCHREEGDASNTNFNAQWQFEGSLATCNKPISYGGQGLSWIISPGAADESIMIQRMEAIPDGSGDQMPPLGRELVHSEGTELVKAWIDASTKTPCN
ncbi:MAG: hypothetical protein HWE18_03685 [Gammaproteobacteria bacterium]|nr:hypothetical protein [Gammaproteobacteria bacterium]